MPSANNQKYWFSAKRYGLGWGVPSSWQGWIVLAAYLTLVLGGIPFVKATWGGHIYLAYFFILTIALIGICWFKGEPPRWRRGGHNT